MNKSFYDDKDLREIDEQVSEVIGKPTLVDQMQERNDKVQAARTNWANEFKQYWYIYIPLLVSSVFTAMLGVYMGLAPYIKDELDGSKKLTFNDDWPHLFTALVYVVAFLYVTETGFAIFHHLFHKREEGNTTQLWTMFVGMGVSVIGIIGTGVSGGMVVASALGSLTEFQEVPASAQKWVVAVIPAMVGLHAVLFAAYKLSSRKSKAERIARENEEKLELDQQVRMRGIQAIGKRRIQAAAIRMYEELVMQGLMSQSEAEWALNSGLSLSEIEKKLNRDLSGEGRVGDTSGMNRPAPRQGFPTDQDIPGAAPYWLCFHCGETTLYRESSVNCQNCGEERGTRPVARQPKPARHDAYHAQKPKDEPGQYKTPARPIYSEPQYPAEPPYHPVDLTPNPARKLWRGETEHFTAAMDIFDTPTNVPTIRKGEQYSATETEIPNATGIFWEIRQAGSDEVLTILSSVTYFLINPFAKANGNKVPSNGRKPGF